MVAWQVVCAIYLNLRYSFTDILILVSIASIGSSADLNMTVPVAFQGCVISGIFPVNGSGLNKSLKNSVGGVFPAYSAGERALGS